MLELRECQALATLQKNGLSNADSKHRFLFKEDGKNNI